MVESLSGKQTGKQGVPGQEKRQEGNLADSELCKGNAVGQDT